MASEKPNPSTKSSQNRLGYQTSVLVTRPEWKENIKTLLELFEVAGLTNHPNLRRSDDKKAWHQYLLSLCYPSQPFHGIYDTKTVLESVKLRTAMKKKILDILAALHDLAENKRNVQENLSENERLGSKLHTLFTQNVQNDTSRIERTKNEAAILANELIASEKIMNLRPPGFNVIVLDDDIDSPPSVVRKNFAGLDQGMTDGARSASVKSKSVPAASSSLHFENHESSISRPKRQASGYTGQEAKRRGLDAINSLDEGTKQIFQQQNKIFPLIHRHIMSNIPTEKELTESNLMARLDTLVKRLNPLKASENNNNPMALKIRNEIMIINTEIDD